MSDPTPSASPLGRRFVDRVAMITGVSERGIGAAIGERILREGGRVAFTGREPAASLMKRMKRLSPHVVWSDCDVTDSRQIRQTLDTVAETFGRLDIVVNNAGIEIASPLEAMTDDQEAQLLQVNLQGVIRVTRLALPELRQPGGVVVNVASALGLGGCRCFSVYSASKAGIIGFTRSLAWERAGFGQRVVAVAPAMVHTPMIHKHVQHFTAEIQRQIDASHPLKMGLTHDVAAAVAFLASDEARWITGVTLPLGWTEHYALPVEPFLD